MAGEQTHLEAMNTQAAAMVGVNAISAANPMVGQKEDGPIQPFGKHYDADGNLAVFDSLNGDFEIFDLPTGRPEPNRYHAKKEADLYTVYGTDSSLPQILHVYRLDSQNNTITVYDSSPYNPPDPKTYSASENPTAYRGALLQMRQATKAFFAKFKKRPDTDPGGIRRGYIRKIIEAIDRALGAVP